MKLSLRFRHLLVLVAILVTDTAFTRFVFEKEDDPALRQYTYALLVLSLGLVVRSWRWFSVGMWRWLLLVLVAMAGLAMESYAGWGQWMVYPHVFSKLTPLLVLFGAYAYYRRHGVPPLGFVLCALPLLVVLNIVLYHPETFTLGGFLGHERGVDTTSALLLVLPAVYFLNRYLLGNSFLFLFCFFADLGIIIFLQHRTVWLSTALALVLDVLLVARAGTTPLRLRRFLPIVALPLLFALVGGLTMVLNNPDVLKKLNSNVEDISNTETQGTGSWRLQQFEAYEPFLREYPVAGMRLEGFELPMQFFNQESGEPIWPNYTGHHFHSFYVDRLFYFGVLGLLLVIAPVVLLVGRCLRQTQRLPLPPNTIALVAYAGCGLLYGVSYDWPIYFFGIIGFAIAAVEVAALDVVPPPPVAAPRPVRPQGAAEVALPFFPTPSTPSPAAHASV